MVISGMIGAAMAMLVMYARQKVSLYNFDCIFILVKKSMSTKHFQSQYNLNSFKIGGTPIIFVSYESYTPSGKSNGGRKRKEE
jgi:hypothetical protein